MLRVPISSFPYPLKQVLLDWGANVSEVDEGGDTALSYAVLRRHSIIFRLLRRAGDRTLS